MGKLAHHHHDEDSYIDMVREEIRNQEELLTNDRQINPTQNDHAWDSDFLKEEFDNRK